ncbi:hypothetical protein V499_03464 [Pseudogymnoascus sp. VKM F-103]|uniref:Uncharacterized protein n=1 Tax=Pseudogymnoascus verrucosus TaxID=342668 RepID=A0A1B8GB69_9PEZI|nr:uncharacterized protein VE01_08999 [Pseudogymnoascus verrucosus]KFY77059.1 hypothetical protein V499_03464 [Pseudogymnoascus sp. VKM F-103]OBT93070.1 hypothetical protein VE01_08999 [Pseudogymnoascus verrucosus]
MPRPRTHDSENCWQSVTDPRKRKQIQDRLAQRARRQRLAVQHHAASSPTTGANCHTSTQESSALGAAARQVIPSTRVVVPLTPNSALDPALDLHQDIPTTVYAALFTNGVILSLPCAYASPLPSCSPPYPDAPPDLQPTALQLSTPHARWIDRFPFPRMRDNFILMTVGEEEGVGAASLRVLDQEAFIGDLFCMESFVIREGGQAWDSADWTIGKRFQEKWGWLFC